MIDRHTLDPRVIETLTLPRLGYTPPPEPPQDWETVIPRDTSDRVFARFPVPGGWMYRCTAFGETKWQDDGVLAMAMVFVPDRG